MPYNGQNCVVYIDGYNWYHAIFKHKPDWKWLNIEKFFKAIRPHENIESIKFFTAIIDEKKKASDARDRQIKFHKALETLRLVKIIKGKFQPREVTCRADCRKPYVIQEEKKTDTNIAVEIMSDAFSDRFGCMIVVSGDSDAQPPIEWVVKNKRQIKVVVYIPALPQDRSSRRLDYYNNLGVETRFLPLDSLQNCQFPNVVHLANNQVSIRPTSWM